MPSARQPPFWQLLLESIQRELTYVPLAASFALAWFCPNWDPTWIAAPALFVAGGAHFFYDMLMGQEVRRALIARQERNAEEERDEARARLKEKLSDPDREALEAIQALERAAVAKIVEHQDTLELTGTFAHTYQAMVRSVVDAGVDSLAAKAELASTADRLRELNADGEARALMAKLPELDRRVNEARTVLKDALAKLTLLGIDQSQTSLESLTGGLRHQLALAGEIARTVGESLGQPEAPRDLSRDAPRGEAEHEPDARTGETDRRRVR
ncbi:MAG: hypothetical protein HY815_22795 [Candidatus Riflebacteria bacterium]|nr:hypothetical protein [Candidatus Riflebacteria bacterium]